MQPLPSSGFGKIGAGQERRRWQRVNGEASKQGVLLRLETTDSEDPVLNTFARDVSLGGLSFEVEKSLGPRDSLPLKIFLPRTPSPLDCQSRIAWQEANGHTTRAGVAFSQLSEEQRRALEAFLREVGGPTATVERELAEVEEAEPPAPRRGSRRDQAIWQFEQGVLLYHQRNLGQAKQAFQKVIQEHADIIDVARVARRYHHWCEEEQEG